MKKTTNKKTLTYIYAFNVLGGIYRAIDHYLTAQAFKPRFFVIVGFTCLNLFLLYQQTKTK